jgi:hypothetical protein
VASSPLAAAGTGIVPVIIAEKSALFCGRRFS